MHSKTNWHSMGFETYKDYLNSDIWKEKRNYIISLNPYCKRCGNTKYLQVHHKSYESVGNEKKDDVIVLCMHCHIMEHKNE